jgi:twitching motility protein PilT
VSATPAVSAVSNEPIDEEKRGTEVSGPEVPLKGDSKNKEEEESPLKALAKKLELLKEELVEEKPEVKRPEEMPIPQEQAVPVVENKFPEAPVEEKKEEINNINIVPESPLPKEEKKEEVLPIPEVPKDIPIVDAPATPVSTTPLSTLDQLYPEINSTPTPPVASEEVKVIDEGDNSQVKSDEVEVKSVGSKYEVNINKILDIATERNASDVQISVGYPVMIKIDGSLIAVNDHLVSEENAQELIMPVLSEQKKELLEVNREVDLAYSSAQNDQARFRINAYYAKGNLAASFRLIPTKIRTIEELQLPPIFTQLTRLAQGLILVTGPTGHGKSTTLAAMLQNINLTRAAHLITIEDPIEYIFPRAKAVVDQREMHDDTHSWTVALKSALRQAPDVLLVGEMRDYETIAATITLAETGHLVFATLHTNSASQTIDRIIDVFPENQQSQIRSQLSNIIEAVIAQRLIPLDGGGRKAVCELMLGTPAVRSMIREGKTHQLDNVIRTSADIGMIPLEQSLVKLVRDGLITMDTAQSYAVHPEEVVRLLKS